MTNELEALQRALKEERRIIAAICLDSPDNTIHISAGALISIDKDTAISTLEEPDGSLTISVKPRA